MKENAPPTEDGIKEGGFFLLYFPAYRSVLAYKVISISNKGFPTINYQNLPVNMDGVPKGVVASNSTTDQYLLGWPDDRVDPEKQENMFHHEEDDMILRADIEILPTFLRNWINLPEGIKQIFFSDGDAAIMPEGGDVFGYWRGAREFFFPPQIHPNFISYNGTNIDLRTKVNIDYKEYETELVRDPKTMKKLWLEKIPVKRHTMPTYVTIDIENTLKVYDLSLTDFESGPFSVSTFMQEAI